MANTHPHKTLAWDMHLLSHPSLLLCVFACMFGNLDPHSSQSFRPSCSNINTSFIPHLNHGPTLRLWFGLLNLVISCLFLWLYRLRPVTSCLIMRFPVKLYDAIPSISMKVWLYMLNPETSCLIMWFFARRYDPIPSVSMEIIWCIFHWHRGEEERKKERKIY